MNENAPGEVPLIIGGIIVGSSRDCAHVRTTTLILNVKVSKT